MKRRQFLGAVAAAGPYLAGVLGGGLGLSLAGCSHEASSGPGEIKWDRDVCTRCSMVIGDKRFAAQIRDPNRKLWKFDDIGCAMFWLMLQPFNEQATQAEYWVADFHSGKWLDARQARYLEGKKSPMAYNFAAFAEPEGASLAYAEMKQRVLSRGK